VSWAALVLAATSTQPMPYKVVMAIPAAKPAPKPKPIVHHLRGRWMPTELWNNPMAACMYAEASNQGDDGIYAVGHSLMNRLRKGRFGKTVRDVCFARKQYSWTNADDPGLARMIKVVQAPEGSPRWILWQKMKRMQNEILSGEHRDNIRGATYYMRADCKAYWRYTMTVVGGIGDHIFFKPKTGHDLAEAIKDHKANVALALRRKREAQLEKARRIARRANAAAKAKAKHPQHGAAIVHRVKIKGHKA